MLDLQRRPSLRTISMGCCVSKDSKGASEGTNALNEKKQSEKHTRSNVKSSQPKDKTKVAGKGKHKDQGKPLGGDVPTQNGLSPKEAAALAAEKDKRRTSTVHWGRNYIRNELRVIRNI